MAELLLASNTTDDEEILQYQGKIADIPDEGLPLEIVTKSGKTYVGMVAPTGDGSLVVLQASGEKVSIAEDDVEESTPSKVSAMPEGLLNALNLEDIADLFSYLGNPPRFEVTRRPSQLRPK